jgi:hypothetical protein
MSSVLKERYPRQTGSFLLQRLNVKNGKGLRRSHQNKGKIWYESLKRLQMCEKLMEKPRSMQHGKVPGQHKCDKFCTNKKQYFTPKYGKDDTTINIKYRYITILPFFCPLKS